MRTLYWIWSDSGPHDKKNDASRYRDGVALAPWRLDRVLARARFRKQAWAFSHFCFYPLDRFLPGLSRRIDRRCTVLEESSLLGWLGTQYIVAAVRRGELSPEAG